MFGIGGFELFLILLFGFLIFGPDKLPAIAKTIGKAINKFRTSQAEMTENLKSGVFDKDSDEPFKNPLDLINAQGNKSDTGATAAATVAATAASSASKAAMADDAKAPTDGQPEGSSDTAPKKESFSERKARFDRERAEARAAQEQRGVAAAEATAKAAAKRARERMAENKAPAVSISEATDEAPASTSDELVGAAVSEALSAGAAADAAEQQSANDSASVAVDESGAASAEGRD